MLVSSRRIRLTVTSFLLSLALSAQSFAVTPNDTVPAPSPSAAPILSETELLTLPAHDVEIFRAPSPVRVGDSIILKIPGLAPDAASLEPLPDLQEQGWLVALLEQKQENQKEFRFETAPLKPGALTIPSLPLRDKYGKAIARTNPFNMQVTSAIKPEDQKPSEPAPLRPPLMLSFPWWIAVVGILLTLAVLGAVIYLLRKYRTTPTIVAPLAPVKPVLPEDEEALEALKALETRGPLSSGRFKEHYFRLSEILKAYLGRRYRFDALESTSKELICVLEDRKQIAETMIDRVETLFQKLDLVKFTDHTPLPAEGLDLVRDVREIVMATRRIPAPKPILEPSVQKEGA